MNARRLAAVLIPLIAAPAALSASGGRLAPEELAELEGLFADKRCGTLFERAAELREQAPDDPDLLTIEGNCHVYLGRTVAQRFDTDGFEDFQIAIGRSAVKSDLERGFFELEATFEADALTRALELYGRALRAAPSRPDIVVGHVALLVDADRTEQAMKLLSEHRSALDAAAREDLGRLVRDHLDRGRVERAAALAAGLSEALPKSAIGPAGLALVHVERGRILDAIAELERAHTREPGREDVARELVKLRMTARRFAEAIPLLLPRAGGDLQLQFWYGLARERLAPGSSREIWNGLAETIRQSEATDPVTRRVVMHYARSVRPGNRPTAVMRLRAANEFLDDEIVLPAVVEADHAVADDPRLLEGWVLMARAYRSEQLFDLALEALDEALGVIGEPESSRAERLAYAPGEIVLARAQVLMGLGRHADALEAFDRAARLGHPAKNQQAVAALRVGKRDLAVRLMREVAAGGGSAARWAEARLRQLGESAGSGGPGEGGEGGG